MGQQESTASGAGSGAVGHLLRLLRALNRSPSLDAVATVILEQAISMVPGAQAGSLLVLDQPAGGFRFRAAVGWDMARLSQLVIPEEKMLQRVVFADQPAIIRQPYEMDREHIGDDLAQALSSMGPNQALLTLPIVEDGRAVAYLNLDNKEDPDAFSERDFSRLEMIWEEITLAVCLARERERLRESEALLKTLFDRLADAVFITTYDGQILAANAAASRQTGYTNEELLELNVIHDLAAEEPTLTYAQVNQRLSQNQLVYFEELKRRKDGTLYWTECAVAPLEYRGRPATISVNRDVTSRKRMEDAVHGLQEALLSLGRGANLENVLHLIYRQAARVIAFDAFFIALADRRRRVLRFVFSVEEGKPVAIPPLPLEPRASLTAWVATSQQPLFIDDLQEGKTPVPVRQVGKAARTWAGIPLIAREEVVGVLSIQRFLPEPLSGRELDLLGAFASAAAAAVQNATLYANLSALADKLQAVEQASRRMKLAASVGELYETVLDSVHRILGYQACAILERRGEVLQLVRERGYLPEARKLTIHLSEGKGITAAACAAGEAVYVPDVSRDPRYIPGVPGSRCELAVPIAMEDRVFGVLNVEHDQLDGIPAEDRDLLEIIASELAVGLTGLERLNEVRTMSDKLTGLHRAVQRLQQCSSEEQVLQTAVQVAQNNLGFEICAIDLAEGDVLYPKALSGAAAGMARPSRRGENITAKSWEEGRTLWGNVRDFPEARPARPDLASFISTPIGKLGVLQVVATRPDAFTASDARLAEILAGHLREEIQRVRLEEELKQQAIRDPLTGLFNRRSMAQVMERELERAVRYEHPLAIVMADVDDFKLINDQYGHLQGDRVLKEIAGLLQGSVRTSDYVFRYGGDEFLILLAETGQGAEELVHRLQTQLASWAPAGGPAGLRVGLSLGFAVWQPEHGRLKSPEHLLRAADRVLYQMKRRRKQGANPTDRRPP
ncbi:MAG: GAF domain-containing protein [Candidatus Bipolaricaulaceae bacterium]